MTKILHITLLGELTKGQLLQLEYERQSADILNIHWHQEIYTCRRNENNHLARHIPKIFRNHFLRGLYLFLRISESYKQYDVIMLRYLPFNPFMALILWVFGSKILLIYHGKMIDRLKTIKGIKGHVAASFEGMMRLFYPKKILGVVGVTQETMLHEARMFSKTKNYLIYPNGTTSKDIDVNQPLNRSTRDPIEIIFMSGEFSKWQGLDRLLGYVSDSKSTVNLIIHIIGRINTTDHDRIKSLKHSNIIVKHHGYLNHDQYRRYLARSVAGIAPLAIDRMGVTESCSLKVREYLNSGLLIIANHDDVAFTDMEYFLDLRKVNFDQMINAISTMSITKKDIITRSRSRVEKTALLEKFHTEVCKLCT